MLVSQKNGSCVIVTNCGNFYCSDKKNPPKQVITRGSR